MHKNTNYMLCTVYKIEDDNGNIPDQSWNEGYGLTAGAHASSAQVCEDCLSKDPLLSLLSVVLNLMSNEIQNLIIYFLQNLLY